MYLLMMSLLLCRQTGEGVRKLAKSCRRRLWTAPTTKCCQKLCTFGIIWYFGIIFAFNATNVIWNLKIL